MSLNVRTEECRDCKYSGINMCVNSKSCKNNDRYENRYLEEQNPTEVTHKPEDHFRRIEYLIGCLHCDGKLRVGILSTKISVVQCDTCHSNHLVSLSGDESGVRLVIESTSTKY